MIEIDALVYEYPTTRALDGVTLRVAKGTIAALVGPNGAGKTTLLRCLAALDTPYDGDVRIAGLDTRRQPREVHLQLGYLQDFYGLYDELSVRRCLTYAARSRGVPVPEVPAAVARAAASVDLADRLETPAGELSRGLRQRVAIGQSLVHRPKVLLLDEPAAGLDPEARGELSGLLLGLKADGMTIVVSSHILAELEDYSNAMIIMDRGRVVSERALAAPAAGGALFRIVLVEPRDNLADALGRTGGVSQIVVEGAVGRFRFVGDVAAQAALLAGLMRVGLPVATLAPAGETMEQVYLDEVRKARR